MSEESASHVVSYQDWPTRWNAALAVCERVGGSHLELTVGSPATSHQIAAVEQELGCAIPASLRSCLADFSSSVRFRWFLPEEFVLPPALRDLFSGDCHWDIDLLVSFEQMRRGWVDACFPNDQDPYDRVWHHKLCFHEVGNGDFIALDLSPSTHGQVTYLSHDSGDGHGLVLAPDFATFIDQWSRIGCPGGEDWQILPFLGPDGIDPFGENARLWCRVFGLAT